MFWYGELWVCPYFCRTTGSVVEVKVRPRDILDIRLLCLKQWQKGSEVKKIQKDSKICELKILDDRWCQGVTTCVRQVAVNFAKMMKRKWQKSGSRQYMARKTRKPVKDAVALRLKNKISEKEKPNWPSKAQRDKRRIRTGKPLEKWAEAVAYRDCATVIK